MKGPFERLKYDLRRTWECPVCQHREMTGGDVVTRLCNCQTSAPLASQQTMRLVQDGPRRVLPVRAGSAESVQDVVRCVAEAPGTAADPGTTAVSVAIVSGDGDVSAAENLSAGSTDSTETIDVVIVTEGPSAAAGEKHEESPDGPPRDAT